MAQSTVVRDYRALEIGRRRANRLVLTGREKAKRWSPSIWTGPQFPLRPYSVQHFLVTGTDGNVRRRQAGALLSAAVEFARRLGF